MSWGKLIPNEAGAGVRQGGERASGGRSEGLQERVGGDIRDLGKDTVLYRELNPGVS